MRKPTITITDAHKADAVRYGQERRNARAAQKVAAATATAEAMEGSIMEHD